MASDGLRCLRRHHPRVLRTAPRRIALIHQFADPCIGDASWTASRREPWCPIAALYERRDQPWRLAGAHGMPAGRAQRGQTVGFGPGAFPPGALPACRRRQCRRRRRHLPPSYTAPIIFFHTAPNHPYRAL